MGQLKEMQTLVKEPSSLDTHSASHFMLLFKTLLVFYVFVSTVNIDNTVGAIGFVSRILPAVYPISIIKVDPFSGEPIRNKKGLCIPCAPSKFNMFKI